MSDMIRRSGGRREYGERQGEGLGQGDGMAGRDGVVLEVPFMKRGLWGSPDGHGGGNALLGGLPISFSRYTSNQ